jgi:hypothetical protein
MRVEALDLNVRGRSIEPKTLEMISSTANSAVGSDYEQVAILSSGEGTCPIPVDRRRSQRLPTSETALIKRIYPNTSDPFPARILDLSLGGMGVQISEPFETGTTVEIFRSQTIAIAEVRYCIQTKDAYHAGLSIQDVFTKPNHHIKFGRRESI